eukprot:TRINITY_DN3435_c1_g3_i1.p1 TRINITY_DN3435_c1_g3~~TRINITY_DN3435_c1_g3_i1.p1  ORF type:complete len:368 (-),score=75.93 TRINITY_DN3435_c1_g3_i1:39-1142(-)
MEGEGQDQSGPIASALTPLEAPFDARQVASSPSATDAAYSYQQFVERFKHPSAQSAVNEVRDFVNAFPASLTRSQAARRIHNFLTDVCPRLLKAEAFHEKDPAAAEVAQELAEEGLEKFVVLKLYKLLFRHAPADLREDERVEKCLRSAASAKGFPQDLAVMLKKLRKEHKEVFEASVAELRRVDQYRAPRDKSSCLVNAFRLIEGIVVESVFAKGGRDAEDPAALGRLLAALCLTAMPPNLYSNIEFTAAFRHPSRMTADERRCLSEFAAALTSITGGGGPRLVATELRIDNNPAGLAPAALAHGATTAEDIPLWLVDAGITFHFEDRSANDLLVGEVEELFEEYQRMAQTLSELTEKDAPAPQKT